MAPARFLLALMLAGLVSACVNTGAPMQDVDADSDPTAIGAGESASADTQGRGR